MTARNARDATRTLAPRGLPNTRSRLQETRREFLGTISTELYQHLILYPFAEGSLLVFRDQRCGCAPEVELRARQSGRWRFSFTSESSWSGQSERR
jgi:hypothetical protein